MDLQEVILKFATLEDILKVLVEEGFEPSLYRKGDLWVCFANVGGEDWAEGRDPAKVMLAAATGAEPRYTKSAS